MPVIEGAILVRPCLLVRLACCVLSVIFIFFSFSFNQLSFSSFLGEFLPLHILLCWLEEIMLGGVSYMLEMWDW